MGSSRYSGASMLSPVDVSYIADTIIMLRFFEARGEVRKALSVIKKRTGKHENTLREFGIRRNTLHVGGPLKQFRGVLTGVPEFAGGSLKTARTA